MSDQKTEQKPEHEKRIREALEAGPVQYACHIDGEVQDSCTFDAGENLHDCTLATRLIAKGLCKTDCAEWKPINAPKSTVEVSAADLRALLADLDAARAALSEAKAGGWVAVPVEPTLQMQTAALPYVMRQHQARAVWSAMLAASRLPAPPAQKDPT